MLKSFKTINKRVRENTYFVNYSTFGELIDEKLKKYNNKITESYKAWKSLTNKGLLSYLRKELKQGSSETESLVKVLSSCFNDYLKEEYVKLSKLKQVYTSIKKPEQYNYIHYSKNGVDEFILCSKTTFGLKNTVNFLKRIESEDEETGMNFMSECIYL